MYLFTGKKTKISIIYQENTANFELSPHDTLSHLKEIILQFFPQLPNDFMIHLNHSSKPLNDCDEHTNISQLSKGKGSLTFTISKPKKPLIQLVNTNCLNSTSNSINRSTCKCTVFPISHYCLNCKEFACAECQISLHLEHKSIAIEMKSIDESVRLFAIALQAEISNEMNNYIQIETMFKEKMLIDFFSWKEMIIRKLNKIEMFFKHFEEFEETFKQKFGTIERMAAQTSNKIEKIVSEYTIDKNKTNIDKAKEVIGSLHQSGEIIKVLIEENASRREEFHTNNKINGLFSDLDKIIDEVEALSLVSYNAIKARIEGGNDKSEPSGIANGFNNFTNFDFKVNQGYERFDDELQLKSNRRNKKITHPIQLSDKTPRIGAKIKLHSSVADPSNTSMNQSRYMFTECGQNINNELLTQDMKKQIQPKLNSPKIILPKIVDKRK